MATKNTIKLKLPSKAIIKPFENPYIEHWSRLRCGSYTTEWIAKSLGLHPIPSNNLLKYPVWFDIFRPIIPSDMRQLLKFRGINSMEVRLSELTDKEKLEWIKIEIALKQRPAALLIRTKTLHWIAIGGYDDQRKEFYIYDPSTGNNSLDPHLPIGNSVISYDRLLNLWSGRLFLKYIGIQVTSLHKPKGHLRI